MNDNDAIEHTELSIPGARCAGCIAKIEEGLGQTPGVLSARVNLTAKRVSVDHDPTIDPSKLKTVLARIGFDAEPLGTHNARPDHRESRQLLKAMGVAGFAAMNIMLLSVSVWSGADGSTRQLFHWLSALIAMPTVAYSGQVFFRSAWSALRHGRTNMDVPISIGVLLTVALSLFETITGGAHAYFDGAVSLLFFLLAGRFLDSAMRDKARDGASILLRLTAPGGTIEMPNGKTVWVRSDSIEPGMRMIVGVGERLAADGVVESGMSSLDCSLVTGESVPQAVAPGDKVIAGTLNIDAPLMIRVTAAGRDTIIAEMARLMDAAGQGRSRYVRIADRASRLYAPAVHSLAALSFAGWMIAGAGWHQSMLIAVAVLIVTCPCALGLAVPVAQVVTTGALMRRGILVKDGSALERMAEVDCVRFDKTGTLTLGRPALIGSRPLTETESSIALALARTSRHPLAQALTTALEQRGVTPAYVTDLTEAAGLGIEGRYNDQRVRLGRLNWIGASEDTASELATAFQIEGLAPKVIHFRDQLRSDAKLAVDRLKAMGLESAILSGDRLAAVRPIAQALNITAAVSMTPTDKLETIERLKGAGHRVLMVGDGLNDGPALAAGHASMAPASASDVGQTAADMVFLGDGLSPVPMAVEAARRMLKIVRQNFVLAIGYNMLAVPLAIAGLVTPLIAAIAMSSSSIIVVGNALRLRNCAR
jgi:Cu2+-exporting ATPase